MNQCSGCRFWSEMVAQSMGGGPVEALCLSDDGPKHGKYTTARMSCEKWAHNHYGAVDAPPNYGEFSRAAYEDEDNGPAGREEYPDNGPADPWQTSGPNG